MAITKVTNSLVAVNAIQGTLIADNAITSVHIAQNQVTAVQIPDGSITSTQIAANSIDTAELVTGSIDTIHIGDSQVTTAKIADLNVTTGKIANNAITSAKIPDGSITETQLSSSAAPTFGNITTTGSLRGPASFTIDPAAVGDNTGTVVIAGSLQVDGTTTTVNSTTLSVADKNITIASGAANAAAANDAGLTVTGAGATMLYQSSGDEFRFNKPLYVPSSYKTGTTATFVGQLTNSGGKLRLQSDSNRDIEIGDTNNADIIYVDTSAQNVGIGTGNVGYKLDVESASGTDTVLNVRNPSNSWGEYSLARFQTDTKDTRFIELGYYRGTDEASRAFIINGQSSNRLLTILESSGKVGIGTAATDGMLTIKKTGSNIFGDSGITIQSADTDQSTLALGLTGSVAYVDSTESGSGTVLPLAFATASAERMRIDASGNVKINNTRTTAVPLHVVGGTASGTMYNVAVFAGGQNSTSGSGAKIYLSGCENDPIARGTIIEGQMTDNGNSHALIFHTSGNSQTPAERMRIDSSGHVGIGMTPVAVGSDRVLSIYNSGTPRIKLHNSTTGTASGDGGEINMSSSDFILENREAGNVRFFNNGSERMRIDSSGKVLIGDSASHTDDLLQIETPASGGGHGIQIRRNDSNNDQGIGHIQFGNNTDTDLAKIAATTDGSTDNARLSFWTQPDSGSLTERMRIAHDGHFMFNTTANAGFKYFIINQVNDGALIFRYNNTDKWQQSLDSSSYDKMFYSYTAGRHVMKMHADGRDFDFISDTANAYTPKLNIYSKSTGAYCGEINFYSKHNSNEWVANSIFATGGSGYGTGNPPSGGMRLYVRGGFGSTHGINAVSIAANGVVSGDFNDTSDVALKKDIVSLNASDSLTAIKALNPVSFKWKLDDEKRSGFIAQEVEQHLPDDVIGEDWRAEVKGEEEDPTSRDEGSKGKAVNSTGILAHAVKVIQEQQTIIEDLKSRIEALEG